MKKKELKELHSMMDDYGYFEPHIYPSKEEELVMFIDQTRLDGNPVMFDPKDRTFTVAVFDDEDAGEYEYAKSEWDEDVTELQIKAYEAIRLARDLAKSRKYEKY